MEAESAAAIQAAESKNRQIEQELTQTRDQHAKEIESFQADIRRSQSRADSARLQPAAKSSAERIGQTCASSTSTKLGQAGGLALVLSDVLGEVDDHAGALAAALDESRLAGKACEREYETLRQAIP
jgi:hypothetical protein